MHEFVTFSTFLVSGTSSLFSLLRCSVKATFLVSSAGILLFDGSQVFSFLSTGGFSATSVCGGAGFSRGEWGEGTLFTALGEGFSSGEVLDLGDDFRNSGATAAFTGLHYKKYTVVETENGTYSYSSPEKSITKRTITYFL